jgi:hypothetical protein
VAATVAVFIPPSVHYDVKEEPDRQHEQQNRPRLVIPDLLEAATNFSNAHWQLNASNAVPNALA